MQNILSTSIMSFCLFACSIFGYSGVEIAPYKIITENNKYQVRHYDNLTLVSTSMPESGDEGAAFGKLFDYISGDNKQKQDIAMTAPVFIDKSRKESNYMAFVLPTKYNAKTAPLPTDKNVKLEQVSNYTVAVITFSGSLDKANIDKHKKLLQDWVKINGYTVVGNAKVAGYNPPFTIPAFRRNEVLLPIKLK